MGLTLDRGSLISGLMSRTCCVEGCMSLDDGLSLGINRRKNVGVKRKVGMSLQGA